jgi:TPR repeat protein
MDDGRRDMLDTLLDSRLPPPEKKTSGQELFRMGLSYATGLGLPRDLIAAHALFALAARLGSLEARVYRKELAEEMELADVAEAERRARDWLKASASAGSLASRGWISKPNFAAG